MATLSWVTENQLRVRISEDLMERLQRLVRAMTDARALELPEKPSKTLSDVARAALRIGVEKLERKYPTKD